MERLRKRIHPPKSGILERSNDEDPTVHMCSFCDKKYSRADSLNDHVRAIHKKTIPCSICSMAFSSKQTLQRHQLTHTSERPHHCLTCGSSFKRRDALTYHEQTVHCSQRSHDSTEPLTCLSRCEFCIKYECPRHHLISVIRHGKPYTNHQCTVCLKITTNCELHWSHHHLDHSDSELPMETGHQCKNCMRIFSSCKALRRHTAGQCHTLDTAEPLYNSVRPITDAQMKAWMKKELDK